MAQRPREEILCKICNRPFVMPKYSSKDRCGLCYVNRKEQQRALQKKDAAAVLSAGELARRMDEIIANELRMPWEKKK